VSPGKSRNAADTTEIGAATAALFGCQGRGLSKTLVSDKREAIVDLDFDGYAIGGVKRRRAGRRNVSRGESSEPSLPKDKPAMQWVWANATAMLEMSGRGTEMFDCVLPTRLARNGTA